MTRTSALGAGEVGYIITGAKDEPAGGRHT